MKKVKDFTDLTCWKIAQKIRLEVYEFCKLLPPEEKYNIIQQIKRAAISIGANIAEGYGRWHWQENIQSCRQARGSLEEVRDLVIAIKDLELAPEKECLKLLKLLEKGKKSLNGYIGFLKEQKKRHKNNA